MKRGSEPGRGGAVDAGAPMYGPIHAFGSACFYVFGVIYLVFIDSVYLFVTNTIFGTLCAAAWFLLPRRLGDAPRASIFLGVVYVGLVNVAVHLGEHALPMVFWGMSISIAAAFLFGRVGVLAWIALALGFYPLTASLKAGPLAHRVIALDAFQTDLLAVATYLGLLSFLAFTFVLFRKRLDRAMEERRQLEARLSHAQKLESLGVLAGGIAHDFNNLLTGILGNVTLAQSELPPSADDALQPLRQAETAALRAAELTRQMLAFSGKGQFLIQTVDINDAIREMVDLLTSSVSKLIEVRLELDARGPRIVADASQFRQLIMNILINAAEAVGAEPGVITIRTGVRPVDAGALSADFVSVDLVSGDHVVIEIQDTGCGMDEATRARLFEPFFTTKFTGRGLGLAAALGIVRGHQGAIGITSAPGKGTKFTLLFACAPEGEPAAAPERARPAAQGSGSVLIIDDEDVVRRLGRAALERAGYRVLDAADGVEGLESLRTDAAGVDIVLLDLTMPRMGGVETFRELKRLRPELPVVLMTGYTRGEVLQLFSDGAPDEFLEKPFSHRDVVSAVRGVLGR